jgi:ketopantoate hydroxymethyltransferase
LAQAGAFGIVLELVTAPVAAGDHRQGFHSHHWHRLRSALRRRDSGHDGFAGHFARLHSRHVKKSWHLAEQIRAAVVEWKEGVVHPGRP